MSRSFGIFIYIYGGNYVFFFFIVSVRHQTRFVEFQSFLRKTANVHVVTHVQPKVRDNPPKSNAAALVIPESSNSRRGNAVIRKGGKAVMKG